MFELRCLSKVLLLLLLLLSLSLSLLLLLSLLLSLLLLSLLLLLLLLSCGQLTNSQESDAINDDDSNNKSVGNSSLMLACDVGNSDIVKLLLEKTDIDITITNSNNDNCIDIATANNNDEIVTHLLSYISNKDC